MSVVASPRPPEVERPSEHDPLEALIEEARQRRRRRRRRRGAALFLVALGAAAVGYVLIQRGGEATTASASEVLAPAAGRLPAGEIAVTLHSGRVAVWSRQGVRELPLRGRAFGWSPDGSRLLVQRSANLYAVRVDGSGEVLLARHGNGFNAAWSPDGTRIALQRKKPGTEGSQYQPIEVVRADGLQRRRIAGDVNDGGWFSGNFSWSPDGTRLLFAGRTAAHPKPWLFVAATDGSSPPKPLTIEADVVRPTQATWSPDGTRIAFVANAPPWPIAMFGDLYVMRADGSDVRRAVGRASRAHGPVWSPDSSKIAFRANGYEVVRADGTGRIRLPGRASWAGLTWSPDSKWLAQIGGSGEGLWLVRADGSRFMQVLHTPRAWYAFPLWRGGTATTEAR